MNVKLAGVFTGTHDREVFTAWITKFALTTGIFSKRVELCSDISDSMVSVVGGRLEHYHGKDWHQRKEDAIRRAREMQAAKLKSIDAQRKRIMALKFEV